MSEVSDDERLRARHRPSERRVMRQLWRHLGFLHWPVAPAGIARLLPRGLDVDTFGGSAYVGIVPFTIPLTRTGFGAPMAPAFHELNLRTYVHRGGREPGVWFFSLDATSRLAVAGARLGYGLPYFHAGIRVGETSGGIDYWSRRRASRAAFRARYQPAGAVTPAAPGSLEFFLVERYVLYAGTGRRLRSARVHHAPYPLQAATAADVEQTLTDVAGLPAAAQGPPPLVHYAHELDVAIYRPHRTESPPAP